ncbi:hypothetical protein GGI07_004873 [Coemansia sp. Benny D115]|nr:hypothetical protein GGI07_004873 [Coemansia sp. Benny D115]
MVDRLVTKCLASLLSFAVSAVALPQFQFSFGEGLADPFTGSGVFTGGAFSFDSNGNSVARIDQDRRVHGQSIANLNENSVVGQQAGPAIEADNAVVVAVANN